MPYISVVIPTMRVGGLDIIFSSLRQQTFKDFELILSDCLYPLRKDIVAEKAKQFGVRVKHVEPFLNQFPRNAFCRCANTGLAYADCELVVFMTDYTAICSNCLDVHQDFHRRSPRDGLACPHVYKALPTLNTSFVPYKKKQIDEYVSDVTTGKLTNVMWSIFEQPFNTNPRQLPDDPVLPNKDPKLFIGSTVCTSNMFHGKNESCSLKSALDVNGWNEELDGTHGWQDTEFAGRLQTNGGVRAWVCNSQNIAYIINPRWVFPFAKRERNILTNRDLAAKLRNEGYPRPNTWSLKNPNTLLNVTSPPQK